RDLAQHPDRRAELARGAVAALEGVVLDERALERMQLAVLGEPLDRDDVRAVVRDRECETGVRAPAVEQDRAGAALAVVAALLRSRQPEVLPQQVEQRDARVEHQRVLRAVDPNRDLGELRHSPNAIVGHVSSVAIAATGALVVDGEAVFPIGLSNPPPAASKTPAGRNGLEEVAANGVGFVRTGIEGWSL